MSPRMSRVSAVLLLGATGRTGRLVLSELLARSVRVRAIVRSARRLPDGMAANVNLETVEAELLSLSDEEWKDQVRGCDAVISCLGHNVDLKGIFGPPRDLVARATERACRAIAQLRPEAPVKFVLMSSVSVNRPGQADARRGRGERALLALIRFLAPPARDNQEAADFLCGEIGQEHPYLRWVAVRPDTLVEGEAGAYALHEGLVSSLAEPDRTARANVARFMRELATEPEVWEAWEGRHPVIVDAASE